jgi:hypothetical protein
LYHVFPTGQEGVVVDLGTEEEEEGVVVDLETEEEEGEVEDLETEVDEEEVEVTCVCHLFDFR